MRRMLPLVLAMLALAGCVDGADDATPRAATPTDGDAGDATTTLPADSVEGVAAPDLPVGRAWQFEVHETYSSDTEITVVVARASPSGYLFAGGSEDDLVYPALWRSPWFGERTRELNDDGVLGRAFAFPLVNGKSWELYDGLTVTARAADVPSPSGATPGFVIEGSNEHAHVRYTYAPAYGTFTEFLNEFDGAPFERITLRGMSENASWVWFEPLEPRGTENVHEPLVVEVTAEDHALLVSGGGANGGRMQVAAPDGTTTSWTFEGAQSWQNFLLPPTAGSWVATVEGKPYDPRLPPVDMDDPPWAYVQAAPIQWIRGP